MAQTFDVCIRGAGAVGRTLALLLAQERLRVALVAAPEEPAQGADVRAWALNAASRSLLQSVRGWPDNDNHATPVLYMGVQADGDAAVHFDAGQQGCEALVWIVDVPALHTRLMEAVRYQPLIETVDVPTAAPLTVVCEGRASQTRAEFGAQFDAVPYPQHAIATRLVCELPHGQTARQWFTADGSILAFLPLDGALGDSVAVVWSVPASLTTEWLLADETLFTEHLYHASRGALGTLHMVAPRATWPLQQAQARQWCGLLPASGDSAPQAWVLAGDAAHNVHPLAGQGLNLGLADAQVLARVLRTRPTWRTLGDIRALRRYERERKAALLPARLMMDGLQQLFTRHENTIATLRNWGMKGFERSGPIKTWLVRQAMGTALSS